MSGEASRSKTGQDFDESAIYVCAEEVLSTTMSGYTRGSFAEVEIYGGNVPVNIDNDGLITLSYTNNDQIEAESHCKLLLGITADAQRCVLCSDRFFLEEGVCKQSCSAGYTPFQDTNLASSVCSMSPMYTPLAVTYPSNLPSCSNSWDTAFAAKIVLRERGAVISVKHVE